MQDIIHLGTTIAFFAICASLVRGLDRLVRGAEEAESSTDPDPGLESDMGTATRSRM